MATSNCLVTNILQNIFFCVQQRKEAHTGLGQLGRVNDRIYVNDEASEKHLSFMYVVCVLRG